MMNGSFPRTLSRLLIDRKSTAARLRFYAFPRADKENNDDCNIISLALSEIFTCYVFRFLQSYKVIVYHFPLIAKQIIFV